jgi:hypothetical protein
MTTENRAKSEQTDPWRQQPSTLGSFIYRSFLEEG